MTIGALRVYDADQVSVSLGGISIGGYADGEFVTITMDAPAFTKVVGTDGETSRSKTNNRGATVMFKLMQTSGSNDLLTALYKTDMLAPGGVGAVPLMIRDAGGTALFVASKAWIAKAPDVSFDRTAKPREWTIECADMDDFHGGNVVAPPPIL